MIKLSTKCDTDPRKILSRVHSSTAQLDQRKLQKVYKEKVGIQI
jgi:hypothetical protein